MKFENPTMAISMFEVENVVTTASAVENVNDAVNNFIADNNVGAPVAGGIKLVF